MKKENGKAKDKMKEKPGPVVDPTAAQQLNWNVLKRYDADIEEVLANSAHVTMYTLNVDTKQWARKQVEGSLFLLRRKTAPKFQLLVLNKLSTDNYVETLHDALDFEVHPPYLMYTHGNDEVVGVWFYENQDLEKVAAILEGIKADNPAAAATSQAPNPAPAAPAPQPQPAQDASANNLQELLVRAHQRHQEQQRQVTQQPRTLPQAASGPSPVQPQAAVQPPPNIPIRPPPPQAQGTPPVQMADRRPAQPSPVPYGQQFDAAASPSRPSPSGQPPAKEGDDHNILHKLFGRAMHPVASSAASTPSPAPKQPTLKQQGLPDAAERDKVRQAFSRLLQNDAFVDMLATEFKSAGLQA